MQGYEQTCLRAVLVLLQDTVRQPRRAVVSPFGNTTARQWQTRDTVKQTVGLLHKLEMKQHSQHLRAHRREKERKRLKQRSPLSKRDENEDYSNADQGEMRFSNTAKGEIQTGCISQPRCKLYLGVFFREAKPASSLICKYTEVIFPSEQLQAGANNPLHLPAPGSEVADNESLLAAFLATQIHLSLTADCSSFSSTNAWWISWKMQPVLELLVMLNSSKKNNCFYNEDSCIFQEMQTGIT